VLVTEFDYHLPEELIAQEPLPDRAGSRMLVLDRARGTWEDRQFRELPQFLRPADCLVLNDSRVFPSRLFGRRLLPGGQRATGKVEVFLTKPLSEDRLTWQALVHPGRKVRSGESIFFSDDLTADVLGRGEFGERTLRLRATRPLDEILDAIGHVPLPPYIDRADTAADRSRYQTVFAGERGSVAAPTAGLHFTPEVLADCERAGAAIARVTLHVGLGTFQPLRTEVVEEARLHSEHFSIPADAAQRIAVADRIVAAGTTSVRTIETWAATGHASGETDIFIYPGYSFRRVGALLTNFHLPKSSLLLLVSAFAGRELTLAAYRHAVREQYRFFSYGDCMLIV
jgi:S-adenosylmethionine:tRNA ribosyltransferase-isomerase